MLCLVLRPLDGYLLYYELVFIYFTSMRYPNIFIFHPTIKGCLQFVLESVGVVSRFASVGILTYHIS